MLVLGDSESLDKPDSLATADTVRPVERGRITLRRERAWPDSFRAYRVTIDGKAAGRIRRGEEKEFEVAAGHHVVQLRIDWARSRPVDADVLADRTVSLSCRGRNPLLWPWWATFGCRRYPRLARE